MASSLLILLDDIALVLDDVAVMTKVAAKKTAGVLGDDLALNAQQVTGVRANRELPVVWAVAKGSFVNKLILIPMALVISATIPVLITPLLMIGGLFLCYEGAEKIIHQFAPTLLPHDDHNHTHNHDDSNDEYLAQNPSKNKTSDQQSNSNQSSHSQFNNTQFNNSQSNNNNPNSNHHDHLTANAQNVDLVAFERQKIKGAIRTDFILSAEIVVISLGTMVEATLLNKAVALSLIGVIMTVGVYGFVAMIVKMDDVGLILLDSPNHTKQMMGKFLLGFAPKLMKFLSIAGTLAMFLVGGGILVHGVHFIGEPLEHFAHQFGLLSGLIGSVLSGFLGFLAGLLVLFVVVMIGRLKAGFIRQ